MSQPVHKSRLLKTNWLCILIIPFVNLWIDIWNELVSITFCERAVCVTFHIVCRSPVELTEYFLFWYGLVNKLIYGLVNNKSVP